MTAPSTNAVDLTVSQAVSLAFIAAPAAMGPADKPWRRAERLRQKRVKSILNFLLRGIGADE